jgi:hypothetical protein
MRYFLFGLLISLSACASAPELGKASAQQRSKPSRALEIAGSDAVGTGCQLAQIAAFTALCGPCALVPAGFALMQRIFPGDKTPSTDPDSNWNERNSPQGRAAGNFYSCVAGFM